VVREEAGVERRPIRDGHRGDARVRVQQRRNGWLDMRACWVSLSPISPASKLGRCDGAVSP
jgi:hypothetical protein